MDIIKKIWDIANKNSDKVAVVDKDNNILTYSELVAKADVFATMLYNKNIKNNDIVAVITEKNIEMISCILGILKVGATYMLIDENMSSEKKKYILNDSKPKMVFVNNEIDISEGTEMIHDVYIKQYIENVQISRNCESIAYIVYTSGTTGNPKGVIVKDTNIFNYVSSYIDYFDISSNDSIIQQSPLYYDGFAEEIFSMLMSGGTIVIPNKLRMSNFKALEKLIKLKGVTIVPTTPLVLNEFNKMEKFEKVRAFISSGDILSYKNLNNIVKYTNVYNMYGTTETTVCATVHKCEANVENISVGKALAGYEILVIDDKGEKVSESETGEIVILGKGVVAGYLNTNMEKESNFKLLEERKSYFTGDYGYIKNQELYFVGRKDRQIKYNANRINLNEVEHVVMALKGISAVACVNKTSNTGKMSITIYFVSDVITTEEVKQHCKEVFPSYLRPIYCIKVDELPITDTGKINYRVLKDRNDLDNLEFDIEELIQIIVDNLQKENQYASYELQLDSLKFMSLIVELEEKLDFEFEDEYLDVEKFSTIYQICEYIRRRIRNEKKGPKR